MTDAGTLLADKYRLGRLIGKGGMGGVYESINEQIGKRVAVKLLKPELAFDGEMVVRFMREARVAAGLGHPCIVDVYDVGATPDGALFLIMELLEGETLEEVLLRTPALDLSMVTYCVCQVLSALDAAHHQDVTHRDIKPANIFLSHRGQALPDVKLLDFGVSKIHDPTRPGGRLTKTGAPVGTPSYMAPEQVLGEKDVDHRVDIYATGVLLYQCLTGRRPFVGDEIEGIYQKIVEGHFTAPSRLRGDIPPAYEQVILTAMSHRRGLRYPSAAKMLSCLMPFLDERVADRVVLPAGVERQSTFSSFGPPQSFPPPGMASTSGPYPVSPARPSSSGGASHRGLAVAVALGALALVALVVAFAIFRPWERGSADNLEVAAPQVPQPSVPPQPATTSLPPPAPIAAPPAASTANTVRITIEAQPPEATLSVDGRTVSGNPSVAEYPRDGREHRLGAAAEGHETRERVIRFDRDQAISLQLVPTTDTRRRRRNSDQQAPTARPESERRPAPPLVTTPPRPVNAPRRLDPPTSHRPTGLATNPF